MIEGMAAMWEEEEAGAAPKRLFVLIGDDPGQGSGGATACVKAETRSTPRARQG